MRKQFELYLNFRCSIHVVKREERRKNNTIEQAERSISFSFLFILNYLYMAKTFSLKENKTVLKFALSKEKKL